MTGKFQTVIMPIGLGGNIMSIALKLLSTMTKSQSIMKTAKEVYTQINTNDLNIMQMGIDNISRQLGDVISLGLTEIFTSMNRAMAEAFEPIGAAQEEALAMGSTSFSREDIQANVARLFDFSKMHEARLTSEQEEINAEVGLINSLRDNTVVSQALEFLRIKNSKKIHGD